MAASQEIDKYTHLLQPIRDLAANWNINIANELGEYLEVLEGITFSFQKGQQLNFAEAALVIQGSACVYSKKVEYLHSLVYQALEFVADRKVKALKSKGKGDAGLQDEDEFDDEEHFLSLDETLEEGNGIDLEEDAQLEEVLPVRLPATLLALEDTGLGDGDGEAGNYRIASCSVHHSGALLLEARDGFMLDEFLQPITNGSVAATQMPTAFGQALPLALVPAPAATSVEEAHQHPHDDDFDNEAGAIDDYFGGDDFTMDDAAPMPTEDNLAATLAAPPLAGDDQEVAFEEEEEEFDPYAPLDPNDTSSIPSKPFKKYSRLPNKPKIRAAQQLPPAHALTDGLLLLPAPATGLLFPEFNYALHQSQLEDAREARKLSREVTAAKQNKKLGVNGTTAVFTMQEAEDAMAAAATCEDEDNMLDGDNGFDPGFFDDQIDAGMPDDDDLEGSFADTAALGGANGWGFGGSGGPLSDLLNENGTGDGEISYEDLCRAHVESLISAAAAAEVQTELASRVSTWRMKMAPVLEEEDARPEFDIHYYGERILQGLAKLSVADTAPNTQQNDEEDEEGNENPAPRGKNEKSTRDGGGRQNSNNKTDTAVALTGPVEFNQVVTGAEVENGYDVPRIFSSMLQLVNNGNLRVAKIKDSSDNFKIILLSTELKHKRIEAYVAPTSAAAEAEGMGEVELEAMTTTITQKKPISKRRKA